MAQITRAERLKVLELAVQVKIADEDKRKLPQAIVDIYNEFINALDPAPIKKPEVSE